MEGTLSLLDWRESSAPAPALAEGSAPIVQPARVVVFDCETTGTDRTRDQVIELCVQHGLEDHAPNQVWRMKPQTPIHPGARAVHGISEEDLAACPTFAELADEIAAVFDSAEVIVGYNLTFDIDMLQAEYARIGRPWLDLSQKKIVDAYRLWQQFEPRSLQNAHQKFVGEGFASAHTASADVAATGRVLSGMLKHYGLAGADWVEIAQKCDPTLSRHGASMLAERASWVGPTRHLRWDGEVIVVGFGKYLNAPLHELAAGPDRSFLRWVLEKDFPIHVGELCRKALELPGEQFLAWAKDTYQAPSSSDC
ncbi:MAG: exonuclease domain-containing protein [Kofleriaceae bacterium]